MLTVVGIKASSVQSGYYLKQDGGYYIEDASQKNLYQWMGKGAESLGMIGAVTQSQYSKIFNGILPNGDTIGKRKDNGELLGRPGYDLTFSMNKDISLIICCSDNKELKQYFLDAHHNAVKTAMHEVEKLVSARKTADGKTRYELTKNMVAALCTHFSSRAGDPQVHTHACVANMTQRSDGQWRALSTDMSRKHGFYEKIRDNATLLGHIYQNELAIAAREKGFTINKSNKHGMFEIEGLPLGLKEHFSKRRMQIEKIVDSLDNANKYDKKLYDVVAQHSRAAKEKLSQKDFMAKSKIAMQSYLSQSNINKTFDSILIDCCQKDTINKPITTAHAKEAIDDAIESLSRYSFKLDANKIIDQAIVLDLGQSMLGDLQQALRESIDNNYLLQTKSGHFTSQKLIDKELQLKRTIQNNSSRLGILKESKSLEANTSALDSLINELESQGKSVTVLAQTKSMASNYNEYARSKKRSLWDQLKNLGKSDRAQPIHSFLPKYTEQTSNPLNNMLSKKGNEVFIVEDSGRLNIDVVQSLITATETRHSQILFLSFNEGRRSQLAGNVVSTLKSSGVQHSNLVQSNHINKSKNPDVNFVEVRSDINSLATEKQKIRHHQLISDVIDKYEGDLSKVAIYASSRKAIASLTANMRDCLKQHGYLGKPDNVIITERPVYLTQQEQKHAKFFKPGMLIKTYVGGCFEEKLITRIDEGNNRVAIKGTFKREKYHTPNKVLKNQNSKLYLRSEMRLSNNETIRALTENTQSKQMGLSINTAYTIYIDNDRVTLQPENKRHKTIKTKLSKLNGLDLGYNYVKRLDDNKALFTSKKDAVIDLPAYLINSNTINSIARTHHNIEIYTDNKEKAVKRAGRDIADSITSRANQYANSSMSNSVQVAIDHALSVVASRHASFSHYEIIKKALSYGASTLRFEDVREELISRVQNKDLIAKQNEQGEVFLATKETIALESSIIQQIDAGKASVTPFLSESAITNSLSNTHLTAGQKSACELIASTADRFIMVQGYAGTGKSTMLETLKSALQTQAGFSSERIIAVAPTHKAVMELNNKGMHAQTLKQFLVDQVKYSEAGKYDHLQNTLIILDEASMVSNTDFKQLQDIVENARTCHCVYIGDIAQLLSVEAGKPSELSYISKEANIKTATMDDVLRQQNPQLKTIAYDLIDGSKLSTSRALNRLEEKGFLQESSIEDLAVQYANMTNVDRKQTLVGCATNENRKYINLAIRDQLIKRQELQGDQLSITTLQDSRLTDGELRHAVNYNHNDVVKINNAYYTVHNILEINNTLETKNASGVNKAFKLDLMPKSTLLELFKPTNIDISKGDLLKWTKTDKDRGLIAHSPLVVDSINPTTKSIAVKDATGDTIHIDALQKQNQHIDYGYCSTIHAMQGATARNVVVFLDQKNKKANTLRLMYVGATRATHNLTIHAAGIKQIKQQILDNKGNKASALQSLALLEEKSAVNPKAGLAISDSVYSQKPKNIGASKISDAKEVEALMRQQARHICETILGQPNKSLSTSSVWKYGRKGSLSISVDGEYQGSFNNFETGEKGGMIQLLISELGMSFKSALEQGNSMICGNYNITDRIEKKCVVKNNKPHLATDKKKTEYINDIIKRSKPIKGTVVERYLKSRAITSTENIDLRMISKINTGLGNKHIKPFASALLAIAKDKDGVTKAIQITYLDPATGKKIENLPIAKRSIGSLKAAFVDLSNNVHAPEITFVAEGIETALSIKDSLTNSEQSRSKILVSLGKSNLKNLLTINSSNNIALVLDNDKQDWKQDLAIVNVVSDLKTAGKHVQCLQPSLLDHKKTDFNDLAMANRSRDIKLELKRAFTELDKKELELLS
jgi:conjugative relaxase-like TrwC/TraI family protein